MSVPLMEVDELHVGKGYWHAEFRGAAKMHLVGMGVFMTPKD